MKRFYPIICLTLLIVIFFSCDKKSNPTESNNYEYSQSDLAGTWEGNTTIKGSSNDGTYKSTIIIDNNGKMVSFSPSSGFDTVTGTISVKIDGQITGGVQTTHIETIGYTETTTMTWDGSKFLNKTQIDLIINSAWSSTNGSSGNYTIKGTMNKK